MFRPLQDYILVKPLIREQSKILEVISYEKQCRGIIIAVGPGKYNSQGKLMPLDAKPGQIVAFGDGNFDFYPYYREDNPDGTYDEYRIVQEADICFVDEDDVLPKPSVSHETSVENEARSILKTEIERLIPECAA